MKAENDREQLLKNLADLKQCLERAEREVSSPLDPSDLRSRDIAHLNYLIYEIEHQLSINKLSQDLEEVVDAFEESKKILEERRNDFLCKVPCEIWNEPYTEWKEMYGNWRKKWDI